jgi:hypothetical protein
MAPAGPRSSRHPQGEPDRPPEEEQTGEGPDEMPTEGPQGRPTGPGHPEAISDREAVLLAHREEIDRAVAYLSGGLSVLAMRRSGHH